MTERGAKADEAAEHPSLIELLRASGRGLNYEDVVNQSQERRKP